MANAVTISGLTEINRSLKRAGPLYYKAARTGLIQGAEPVRQDAGRFSQLELSGMKRAKKKPPPWSIQRIGATQAEVYMVPKQRGRHGGRDARTYGDRRRAEKFVQLMLGKSYEPALERNVVVIRNSVNTWLGKVTISL